MDRVYWNMISENLVEIFRRSYYLSDETGV